MAVTAGQYHAEAFRKAHQSTTHVIGYAFTDDQLVHTLGKSHTHILWTIGHFAFVYDTMFGTALGLAPTLPSRYAELFTLGSKPTGKASDYPPVAEIMSKLDPLAEKLTRRIEGLTDEQLAQPLPPGHILGKFFPTLGAFLHAGVFHSGYHAGQIGILRVAQGLPSPFGA